MTTTDAAPSSIENPRLAVILVRRTPMALRKQMMVSDEDGDGDGDGCRCIPDDVVSP